MFSKACEYGIRAVVHISFQSQQGRRVSLKEVAAAIDSPVSFTAKILQSLANNDIISSIKGVTGGYEIGDQQQKKLSLYHIVKAIDGDRVYTGCAMGLKQCDEEKPCPLHFKFITIREDLKQMLHTTTIAELTNEMVAGMAYLRQ